MAVNVYMDIIKRNPLIEKGLINKINIGIFLKNENDEILIVKENIDSIGKTIYTIPNIEIDKFDSNSIIRGLKNKYKIDVANIDKFLNKDTFLDENCNEKIQINLGAKVYKNRIKDTISMNWFSIQELLDEPNVIESLKKSIEIYKYNSDIENSKL